MSYESATTESLRTEDYQAEMAAAAIADAIERVSRLDKTRDTAMAATKLDEAAMWTARHRARVRHELDRRAP